MTDDVDVIRQALDVLSLDTLEIPLAQVLTYPRGDHISDTIQDLAAAVDRLAARLSEAESLVEISEQAQKILRRNEIIIELQARLSEAERDRDHNYRMRAEALARLNDVCSCGGDCDFRDGCFFVAATTD